MSNPQIEIQLIAVVVAAACAIPGVFLVLRKTAMISDAISHAILPGIVAGFFLTRDLSSPWLVLMATLTGMLTVVLVEVTHKTGLVKEDAAIGLVFPALFSIGVILIARFAGSIHLDTDVVLSGEIAFAPFDRLYAGNTDLGPKSIWVMGGILLISLTLLIVFYKELKISTFDPELAATLGFTPVLLHYSLMLLTSVTTVGAFDAVGAILVVALMIVPAGIAYLLTSKLKTMLWLAVGSGTLSAIAGYWLARRLDGSIPGSMAVVLGLFFLLTYLFSSRHGVIPGIFRLKRQKKEYALLTFLLHIKNHSGPGQDPAERDVSHLNRHFNWSEKTARMVLNLAGKNNLIQMQDQFVSLTPKGETFTEEAVGVIIHNEKAALENIKGRFLLFRG